MMRKVLGGSVLAAAALVAGLGSAMAQSGGASPADKKFLMDAAQGGNFEIQAAQLALQKSSSDDVKKFAQMMIDDHTKLNEQMKPVASEAGVTPPTDLSKKDQKLLAQLKTTSGNTFDKRYIQVMLGDHQKDLKEFKAEASTGQLASEKSAAEQGTPIIQSHLDAAKAMAKAHNVSQPSSGLSPSSNS